MALAKITILGFKSYMEAIGEDLFKNLSLPEGIDRDTLIENIYNECGDFEMLYSNPFYVQSFIGTWSQKHYRTFQKWIDALNIEYDPLYNYDRHEEWTEDTTGSYSNETSATASTTDSATTTNQISSFDSSTLQNDTESTSSGTVGNTSSGDNSGTNEASNIRTGRAYGNIGVTTSQQMLQSELDIARFNIINNITDVFVDEFCIAIYV